MALFLEVQHTGLSKSKEWKLEVFNEVSQVPFDNGIEDLLLVWKMKDLENGNVRKHV